MRLRRSFLFYADKCLDFSGDGFGLFHGHVLVNGDAEALFADQLRDGE